jgi:hypothetical protein
MERFHDVMLFLIHKATSKSHAKNKLNCFILRQLFIDRRDGKAFYISKGKQVNKVCV